MSYYEFSTTIDFLGLPITLSYKSGIGETKVGEKLTGTTPPGRQLTFAQILEGSLATFGATGLDLGFDGLGVQDIELNFDIEKETVDFKSKVDLNELWMKFSFNFREIKKSNGSGGFVFEFIPDATGDNNTLAFPGGLPLINDELKKNLYIEFTKVVVATTTDPADPRIREGMQFFGKYKIFGSEQPLDIFLFGPAPNALPQSYEGIRARSAGPEAIKNNLTKWFDIDKSLGPFTLQKIGFQYDNLIWALVSADLKMGPLTFSLDGLKIGSPIKFPPKPEDIEFGVNGIGLSMDSGPISIAGAFMKAPDIPDYYSGLAIISFSEFTIDAFGGYGELPDGSKSVFIFASVNIPIGGPPFFFIKGFSLGFGFNMDITLPSIREVTTYPLLDTSLFQGSNPSQALTKLNQYVYPQAGRLWFAVGIKFTTFEVVDSNAVLIVDIGKVQISVLGLSVLALPKVGYAFVYVKMGLMVAIKIKEGVFMAFASIDEDSYLLHSSCRVFGDFAFYSWFKGANAGDFVFSIGGYHPRFNKPAHYPDLRRLGFEWRISSVLRVGGNVYFTLTPSAVMAGFRIEAVFDIVVIKAWFIAIANFLIQWKPFYYDIEMEIRIGVKIWIFKFELGVALWIYGPPVGGRAWVSVGPAEFEIRFGERVDPKPPLLSWPQFQEKYLPRPEADTTSRSAAQPPEDICRINIGSGLLKKAEKGGTEKWLVRADELILNTETFFPVQSLQLQFYGEEENLQTVPINKVNAPALGIRPMGIPNMYRSEHRLHIENTDDPEYIMKWTAAAKSNGVPAALWGTAPVDPHSPEAENIPATVGLRQVANASIQQIDHDKVEETLIKNFNNVNFRLDPVLTDSTEQIYSQLDSSIPPEDRIGRISRSIPQTRNLRTRLIGTINEVLQLTGEHDRLTDNLHQLDIEAQFQSIPRMGAIVKNKKKLNEVQPIKKLPLEEELAAADAGGIYFKMRQALRQYSPAFISDFTSIQKDLFTRLKSTTLRIQQGATYIFDVGRAEEQNRTFTYDGGAKIQVLAFDAYGYLLHAYITKGADLAAGLLPGTRYLFIQGLPAFKTASFACGWTQDHALPRVNRVALVGPQFVLQPQAPVKTDARGWVDLRKALAYNVELGEKEKIFRAYTDTQFFNRQVREVVVLLKIRRNGGENPAGHLQVSVPYYARKNVSELIYEKHYLKEPDVYQDGSFIRLRYKVGSALGKNALVAIRARVRKEKQRFWEVYGVIGLCGNRPVPGSAWLDPNLVDSTYEVKTGLGSGSTFTID